MNTIAIISLIRFGFGGATRAGPGTPDARAGLGTILYTVAAILLTVSILRHLGLWV